MRGALQSYEQALAIARDYAKSVPGNLEGRRDVTVTLDKIGDAKWKAGDTAGSLAAYEESLDISRGLAGSPMAESATASTVGDVSAQGETARRGV